MALQRGYGDGVTVTGASSQRGPKTFWLPPGTETTVVLLDGDPVEIVRHMLFLKGDKTAARMRQTCWGMNPRQHPEPCPRQCLVCNKSLSAPRQIGRKMLLCGTLIDERQFEWQGKTFKDMKMCLELPQDAADGWRQQKAALGQIQYRRFRVYRSKAAPNKPQTSPRHGDRWYDLGPVDPVRHFWNSPAIKALMDAAARRGEPIDHQTAVMKLITPIEYDTEMGVYNPAEAEAFVAYLEGRTGGGAGGGAGFSVPSGAAPPPPPSSMPSYGQQQPPQAPQAPQQFSQPGAPYVPPQTQQGYQPPAPPPGPQGQPTFGQPPAAPQQGYQAPPAPAPAAVPPGQIPMTPQAGYQPPPLGINPAPNQRPTAPPPPVPDPAAAGGQGGFAAGGYQAPPMPQAGSVPAPGGMPAAPANGAPPWNPTPPQQGYQGAAPAGLPPMPGGGTPQEGVNRIPAGASMPTPGAMMPPGGVPAPAPPAGFPGMAQPAPMAAGAGYAPPGGPPQGSPLAPPQGAPAPAAAPAAAPVGGFNFGAGFNPNQAPGIVPPMTDPSSAGAGF